jgi:hypothetical protein
MIRKLSLFLIASSEDRNDRSYVLVLARRLPSTFSGAALASLLAASSALSLQSRSCAHHGAPSAQATYPRRLPRLPTGLHSLVRCRTRTCSGTPLERGQKPARCPQTHRYPGFRLSQPEVLLLRKHRCTGSRTRRGWQAWPSRAHPDVPLSGVSHHLQCSRQHPVVPVENPFPAGRHGPLYAVRRAGPFSGRKDLRLSTSHDYEVAYSCRRACSDVAQADLLPSPAPTPPAGRTANTAPLR